MPHVHSTYNGVKATFLSHVSAYLCCDFRDIELKVCIFLLTYGEGVDSWLRQDNLTQKQYTSSIIFSIKTVCTC